MRNKVIIDTNLWISFLISKNFSFLDNFIINKKIELVFNDLLLNEFTTVIERPKLKKYFSDKDIYTLINSIEEFAVFFDRKSTIDICRDSKDNFLLALAKDSNADYILTGDTDLLILDPFEKTRILSMTDFIEILKIQEKNI